MGNARLAQPAQRGRPHHPGAGRAPKPNLSCSRDGAKGGCRGIVRLTLARPRDRGVKARRVNLCPADSTESGGGGSERGQSAAVPNSVGASGEGHHCGQQRGRSSAAPGTHGARKDIGHEAPPPKPPGLGAAVLTHCKPGQRCTPRVLWHEPCILPTPDALPRSVLLCTPARPSHATSTKSILPGRPAPRQSPAGVRHPAPATPAPSGPVGDTAAHGAGWDRESLTLQHEARAQTPAQRQTEDGGGSPVEAEGS